MHTKKELEERLKAAGISPLKSLGQNFLMNPRICSEIIHALEVFSPRSVAEIGPGLGALTDDLRTGKWKTVLVELDSGLVEYWKKLWPEAALFHQDALHFDWSSAGMERPAVLVSNLPYSLAASLVVEMSSVDEKPFDGMVLMFQKEVAQRITASPDDEDYGMLSVVAQVQWKVERVIDAGPQDFFPVPHVGSRVLRFTPRGTDVSAPAFLPFVKMAFSQRRKKLVSNLSAAFPKSQVADELEHLGLPPEARAQELSAERFVELFSLLKSKKR